MLKKLVYSIYNGKFGVRILDKAEQDSTVFVEGKDFQNLEVFLSALESMYLFYKDENLDRLNSIIDYVEDAFVEGIIERDDVNKDFITAFKEREILYKGARLEKHQINLAKLETHFIGWLLFISRKGTNVLFLKLFKEFLIILPLIV